MNGGTETLMPVLRVEHLSKSYGRLKALDDVSFIVPGGSVFGIIGRNGAGKSSLLKVVTSLARPDSGNVFINGVDVAEHPERALSGTGAIVEWPQFFRDLTARRNLDILTNGGGTQYEKRLAELADYTGMTQWLGRRVREFSTGMKQRLAIMLALLPRSGFIILDEPTNGLDPSGIVDIRDLIRDCNRDFGTTILVTSHMLGEMEKICTDMLILDHGKVAASGTMREMTSGDPEIRVTVPDAPAAARFIRERFGIPASVVEGYVSVRSGRVTSGELNTTLVKAGFTVSALSCAGETLEEVFLKVAEGGTDKKC